MFFKSFVALGFVMTASFANSAEVVAASTVASAVQTKVAAPIAAGSAQDGLLRLAQHHHHPRFLGCIHDEHECSDRARHAGFQHYFVRRDHDRCHHHPHLACFGRND